MRLESLSSRERPLHTRSRRHTQHKSVPLIPLSHHPLTRSHPMAVSALPSSFLVCVALGAGRPCFDARAPLSSDQLRRPPATLRPAAPPSVRVPCCVVARARSLTKRARPPSPSRADDSDADERRRRVTLVRLRACFWLSSLHLPMLPASARASRRSSTSPP